MTTEKKITTIKPTPPSAAPIDLISSAIASGANLEHLERLMTMQEKFEANEAKKAFYRAMAAFKEHAPVIIKDKQVGYASNKGTVGYRHASLFNVVDTISQELSKHGLSLSWRTEQNGKITVTCRISHEQGYSEETSLSADADTSGAKNSIQAIGSTVSYLQRYTALALTGLATQDQDNDAQIAETKISEERLALIKSELKALESDEAKFASFMGVEKLEDIPASQFSKAKIAIETRKKEKKNANN